MDHYYAYRVKEMKVSTFAGDPDDGRRWFCWSNLRGADSVQYDSLAMALTRCDELNRIEDWENRYPFKGEPYEGMEMITRYGTSVFRGGHWRLLKIAPDATL